MRGSILALVMGGAVALGGCAASIAAGALGAAIQAGRGRPDAIPNLGQAAAEACRAHASRYGDVHIIDVDQRSPGKAIVWGTVGTDRERRSFECTYGGKIAGFKLRPIKPRRGGAAG